MDLSSFDGVKEYVLSKGDEEQDGTSDWDDEVTLFLGDAWRETCIRHPWLCLRSDPPGVLLTAASVTSLTLTVAAAGLAVAGTLSATHATSLAGYKILPLGKQYLIRITAHTAASASVTLDAAPEALSAAECIIYKDEYDVADDLGTFVDGLRNPERAEPIPLWPEDRLRREYPELNHSSGWPPRAFSRIGQNKIVLSHYPTEVKRFEYPYATLPDDPTGSSEVVLSRWLRPIWALMALSYLHEAKSDTRAARAREDYEARIENAIVYEGKLLRGSHTTGEAVGRGPYS